MRLVIDKRNASGSPGVPRPQLLELKTQGVDVRVADGSDLDQAYLASGRSAGRARGHKGSHHTKTLITETQGVIGSCNFTTSSQGNQEAGVLIEWTPNGANRSQAMYLRTWSSSVALSELQW